MTTLILIVQTYSGALAYEYGPYPDTTTRETSAIRRISEIRGTVDVLKIVSECRLLHPELDSIAENDAD